MPEQTLFFDHPEQTQFFDHLLFARHVREARRLAGLSLREYCKAFPGVCSFNTLYRVEKGYYNISTNTFLSLCYRMALDPIEYLMD